MPCFSLPVISAFYDPYLMDTFIYLFTCKGHLSLPYLLKFQLARTNVPGWGCFCNSSPYPLSPAAAPCPLIRCDLQISEPQELH